MTNADRNSLDRVSEPDQVDWGLAVMLVTLLAMASFLILALP